jgi:tryptophan synthase beta chain
VHDGEREVGFKSGERTTWQAVTKGEYQYGCGDAAEQTPQMEMHTLGHNFVPPPVHAGGLRYHGMAPILSQLVDEGVMDPYAVSQNEMFADSVTFAAEEGIIPAPEPGHAIHQTMEEARKCRETGEEKTLAFLLCGHGFFDMRAFDEYLAGNLEHVEYSDEAIAESMKQVPVID